MDIYRFDKTATHYGGEEVADVGRGEIMGEVEEDAKAVIVLVEGEGYVV